MLFGGWGALGNCGQLFGLPNFLSAGSGKMLFAASGGRGQVHTSAVHGEQQGICSPALSGEAPCPPSPQALDVAFLI